MKNLTIAHRILLMICVSVLSLLLVGIVGLFVAQRGSESIRQISEGAMPRIDARGEDRHAVWLSARDGLGIDLLREALGERLGLRRVLGDILLPTDAGRLRARLHALDAVRAEEHEADGWRLRVDLPVADAARLAAQPDGAPLRPLLPPVETDHPVESPA